MSFPTDSLEDFIKFLIGCALISLALSFGVGGIINFVFWDISFNGGIILLMLCIIIVGILILLYFYREKKLKSTHEDLENRLNEKSIVINDEYLIKKIISLEDYRRNRLCKIYNVCKNEDIVVFMSNLNNGEPWNKNELDGFIYGLPEYENLEYYYNNPPNKIVQQIMGRENYKCANCGKPLLNNGQIFFKKEYYEGGTLTKDNLLALCNDCAGKFSYLKSNNWDPLTNHEIMFRDKYVCQNCGKQLYNFELSSEEKYLENYLNSDGEIIDDDFLEHSLYKLELGTNHIFYKKAWFEEGFSTKKDIITVCTKCKDELESERSK